MIHPEFFSKRISELETEADNAPTYNEVKYLIGKLAGFELCMDELEHLSVDNLNMLIWWHNTCPYSQWSYGILDAYIEVGRAMQTDEARSRRDSEIRCATRYAKIQQGMI